MRLFNRLQASCVVGLALTAALTAGCSTSTAPDSPESQPSALASLDPCSVIKPDQLASIGLPGSGVPKTEVKSQPGCQYQGDSLDVTVYKIADSSLEEFGQRDVWKRFDRIDVSGRPGAETQSDVATEDMCSTAVSAGGGVVSFAVMPADPRDEIDSCAESLKIARMVESNLPK